MPSYVSAPDSTHLDNLAYLNLSEMIRYKRIIEDRANRYIAIESKHSDRNFFKNNLARSVQIKLQADRTKDEALYRIAAASISASVEDLISLLLSKYIYADQSDEIENKTLGQKLQLVRAEVEKKAPLSFDNEFFRRFNDFILYLRNSTTHKGRLLTDVEKFKADLSVSMSFPFIEFYTEIVHPLLASGAPIEKPQKIRRLSLSDFLEGTFYYGLDGDNTGAILEDLFLSSSDEGRFRKLSKSVTKAINEISKFIQDNSAQNSVVFEAGDDILFKGNFNEHALKTMQQMYRDRTSGLTCSIGYGRSFREVYLALKLAKTTPGKNSIAGVEFS